jgi:serine/threonine protein kinase
VTSLSQLKLTDEPTYYRTKGLGTIYVGESEQGPVRVRKLAVGNHQIREAAEEVKRWKKLGIKGVENLYCEYHEDETLYIVSEAHEDYTSLAQIIKYQPKLPEKQKAQICIQLVKILLQVEAQGDAYSHGHLCPSNIMVDSDMKKIILQDFGFLNCKAYVSMVGNSHNKEDVYENKDRYTAPENLTQKGNSVKKPSHKADIYSLAMILV